MNSITVRKIPEEILQKIDAMATMKGQSRESLVREIISLYAVGDTNPVEIDKIVVTLKDDATQIATISNTKFLSAISVNTDAMENVNHRGDVVQAARMAKIGGMDVARKLLGDKGYVVQK